MNDPYWCSFYNFPVLKVDGDHCSYRSFTVGIYSLKLLMEEILHRLGCMKTLCITVETTNLNRWTPDFFQQPFFSGQTSCDWDFFDLQKSQKKLGGNLEENLVTKECPHNLKATMAWLVDDWDASRMLAQVDVVNICKYAQRNVTNYDNICV